MDNILSGFVYTVPLLNIQHNAGTGFFFSIPQILILWKKKNNCVQFSTIASLWHKINHCMKIRAIFNV